MEHMTVNDIVKATGGRLLCGSGELELANISIDSRTMKGADLFVPIIGEKVDAHRFIGCAFEAGAAATLTSEHDSMEDVRPWIRVEDTKKALQDIGSFYRERLHIPLIGITGSVGKTTTREMIAAALSAGYQVYKTPGNSNSQVGVPITLSQITEADEIGVLELGMSMPGELTVIAKLARVDMAVITNIGVTHIEQLGSQECIYREKMTIQDGLRDGGILFLNGDDPMLKDAKAKKGCFTVYYGTGENCEYRAEDICLEDGFPVFTAVCRGQRIPMRLHVRGRHNVLNAMAAMAIADANHVPLLQAAEKVGIFDGFQNRQQVYDCNGVTVLDDTYNASPVSMLAALEVLHSMKGAGRKIAVLADMKELGTDAWRYHREIGEWLQAHPVDILYTLGELALEIQTGARDSCLCCHFAEKDLDGLYEALAAELRTGDCVLLKGSNSMKLSEISRKLIGTGQK